VCRRWREAAIETARLREFNLGKARLAAAGAAVGRKEAKREAAQTAIATDVRATDRKLRELHEVFSQRDPRTEVFLALRASGKSIADATAEVDRQFGPETNGGNEDGRDEAI
jgi:hypothetical protein